MLKYVELKFQSFYNEVDSIKLFGALIDAYSNLYNDLKEFINKFENNKILISSLFPKEKDVFLFPKPILNLDKKFVSGNKKEKLEKIKFIKTFRKLKYVSKEELEKILNEGKYSEEILENFLKNNQDEYRDKFELVEIPKVTINRVTNSSEIFYESGKILRVNCTLFFLVKYEENSDFEKIINCLKLLEDRGISPNISVGLGKFKLINYGNFSINSNGNRKYLLSKTCLGSGDNLDSNSLYSLKEIKGFSNKCYIPPNLFLVEGSCVSGTIKGKIIKLPDEKNIKYLLYGKPLFFDCS